MAGGTTIKLISNIDKVVSEMRKESKQRMEEAVITVRNQTLETLSGSRSGRIYRVPGTSKTYTASAPGEPPAQRLGELRQSVSTEVEQDGSIGYVGTEKEYGKALEFGTSKMAARPWLRVSFEKATDKIKSIIGSHWHLGGYG